VHLLIQHSADENGEDIIRREEVWYSRNGEIARVGDHKVSRRERVGDHKVSRRERVGDHKVSRRERVAHKSRYTGKLCVMTNDLRDKITVPCRYTQSYSPQ